MKLHYFLFFFTLISFGNPELCPAGCQTCGKSKGNKENVINDFPYVIKKMGRYILESDLVLGQQDDNAALIIIKSNNVTIDLNGHSLDLKNNGKTGILINAFKNIRIYNGKIKGSGNPGAIQKTPAYIDIPALISKSKHPLQLQKIAAEHVPYQSPFAKDPTRGIGIALQSGVENVYIENITFENNFIGIGGIDKVKNVSIKNCQGVECGLEFSSKKVGSSNHRGGFIIIAPTSVCKDFSSENIKISRCTAYSRLAQFGIAVFSGKNVAVENCIMHINAANQGFAFSESSAITAILCQHVNFLNLVGHGGSNVVNTYFCTDTNITNCESNPLDSF
jgi:hypothetical protein